MIQFLLISLAICVVIVSAFPTRSPPGVNFVLDEDFYMIPTLNGEMQRMSRQEILDHILRPSPRRFNAAVDVVYNLHTRTNPLGIRIFLNDTHGLLSAGFNAAHPVRFTMHGWQGDTTSEVNAVPEFLQTGDFNHVVVDWSAGAKTINYIDARNRVPVVAQHVGLMAAFLVRMGANWSNMYMIGHSLGGQMAGLVGQYLKRSGGAQIEACICLDPAGPLFSATDESDRASPDDCKYVEVIHTNGGLLGFLKPIGNSDFYPNGGKNQPGCGIDLMGSCAHARAPKLFKESLVTATPFRGMQCNSSFSDVVAGKCAQTGVISSMMGDPVDVKAEGLYHLTTSYSTPFVVALGKL